MQVNTKKKNKKRQRKDASTSDSTDRKATHDTPMDVGQQPTMQSLLSEGHALLLQTTSAAIEHVEEASKEPIQLRKDGTTQSEEAMEFNINEQTRQESSQGHTLELDTNIAPIEQVKISACTFSMYVVCSMH
jgi:hypothetical protein